MSKSLKIADDLTLPLTAVTETFGILAARGAGKSNLAAVMAEQMAAAGLPFVVIDPVGSWFGLRAGADGQKDGGIQIPIFGGKHGDVPLERHGGEMIADLVVTKRLSCIIDLSAFESESAKKAFLLDFARRLYLKNEDPLHLFLEEADDYIPQRPMSDEAQLLRAWENIVRRGRSRGLGMTLITQRSASINKSVLTQVQTLFVLRTTGPQDRAAIETWVKYHDTDETLLASLSSLKSGEGWVWSPQFLEVMSRHQFHRRRTFDSGATPKNVKGNAARPVATLADIDLGAIQQRMAETIERAKADDPKELRRQLAEANRKLNALASGAKLNSMPDKSATKPVPALTEKDREVLTTLAARLEAMETAFRTETEGLAERVRQKVAAAVNTATSEMLSLLAGTDDDASRYSGREALKAVFEKLGRVPPLVSMTMHPPAVAPATRHALIQVGKVVAEQMAQRHTAHSTRPGAGDASVGKGGLRRILIALAQRPGLNRQQLGVRAGLSSRSGTFDTYISRARQWGWLTGSASEMHITGAGVDALGSYEPLPTGRDLLAHWLGELGQSGAHRMLSSLADAYPRALSRADLGAAAGLSDRSGTFDTYLSRLRTLELVTGKGELRASEELFS